MNDFDSLMNGKPVAVVGSIELTFTLRRSPAFFC